MKPPSANHRVVEVRGEAGGRWVVKDGFCVRVMDGLGALSFIGSRGINANGSFISGLLLRGVFLLFSMVVFLLLRGAWAAFLLFSVVVFLLLRAECTFAVSLELLMVAGLGEFGAFPEGCFSLTTFAAVAVCLLCLSPP